ncbi:type IX secretion system membrane protein PorP/SprF [Dokdonia sp. Hel_I_53]|uniref:PorP/SprF family type IX secretion system membrane protein n=1 Tax=Dokdonia sp. Hel_I_53 TaxID=1566287 RepID=UPI001199D057|nr:type IX secretion system membrane protein PorP/SprF [Dokdonia sp. Hel_I_53]TVZ52365.1 type IX secretion system PorP/SprF family membrane protein [Dokdonia sp. Hel_I_53]
MSFKKLYFLLALFFVQFAVAQEGIPVYWDYLQDNLYLLHPSMAGASKTGKIRLTARSQWAGVNNAPALQTLNVNSRVGEKIGVGGILYNDRNGYFSQQGAFATFAYHLLLSRNYTDLNQLSFGISGGIVQGKLDETAFGPTNDPIITGGILSDAYFNVDFGMSYNFLDFSAHFTVKNAIPAKRDIFSEDLEPNNQRRYIVSLGYVISPIVSAWSFEPSVLFQATERTGEAAIDGNLKAYYKTDWGRLWGGLSYRRNLDGGEFSSNGETINLQKTQFFTPFIGGSYNEFLVGYTYSYQANDTVLTTGGFHQITLGYNFGETRAPYDCNCPAIN